MAHSLINLGVEGLSATSTKKLVEGNFKDLKAIWSSTEAQLQECLGKVSGAKLRKALDNLAATENQWIHAYHGWPKGFGEKKIAAALEAEQSVDKWPNMKVAPNGQTMTTFSDVCKYVPKYLEWRKQFPSATVNIVVPTVPVEIVKGYYVMSGFRDATISSKLLNAGWIVQERINKDTSILIVADNKESVKTKAAKEKGIRIIMRDQVQSLF
jgi:NAD-dependent DNA ligase